MAGPGLLGDFLRARRAQLRPGDVGLVTPPNQRRVAGLRREELAQLAGVSVSYYTRLEQGQSVNASEAVLDALAQALQLDRHEHAHLHDLASQRPHALKRPPVERVHPWTRDLLRSFENTPALVLGRRADVLTWNPLGHLLLAGHVDRCAPDRSVSRPNLTRMLFLDPHTRELYVDWDRKARAVVSSLRATAGRHPEDAQLASLVGELSMNSPEFAALWSGHQVRPCTGDTYRIRHPLVGNLTITQQGLLISQSPEQSLLVVTTESGSSSDDSIKLLSRLAASHA
jgi:transcriptional regulator with XRE-family HTH domain